MSTRLVRAFLAIIVVGVFMLITGFMALFPLTTKAQVDLNAYADFFAKTASVYTGIIGVIIGYYFGKTDRIDNREQTPNAQKSLSGDHAPKQVPE